MPIRTRRLAVCLLALAGLAIAGLAFADEGECDPLAEGRSLLRTPRHEEGVQKLRQAIVRLSEGEPDATALVWIGRAHFLLEEDEAALQCLERAVALESDNAWAHLWLGIVWKWVEPAKAIAPLREALRLSPDYGDAWYNLAVVLGKLDQDAEALPAILKALELGVDTASAHFQAGVQLCIAGRVEEGFAQYERALALEPTHKSARYNLGLAHYRAKRYEQALEAWVKVCTLSPDDLLTHAQVMKALCALERYDDAAKWREKVFAIHARLEATEREERKSFVFDEFDVGDLHVRVREYFDQGMDQLYTIVFEVKPPEGDAYRVNLEPHAAYKWLGGAMYVLGRTDASGHTTYDVDWPKRPGYEELKRAAIRAMKGKVRAASRSRKGRAGR